MKQKSSTTQILRDFIDETELQYNITPKSFRTDNGGEYISNELKDYLKQKGIVHQYIPPYCPESNGVAERLNRTIGESLRAMLESAPTYDNRLWAEAVSTSVYLKNDNLKWQLKIRRHMNPFMVINLQSCILNPLAVNVIYISLNSHDLRK
jgi:transposase InsO family protein